MKNKLAMSLVLAALAACAADPTSVQVGGSYTVVPGAIPRMSVQTQCTITREAGTLTLNQTSYTLRYEEDEVCGDGKVTYGFEDHGSYSATAGVIVFDSDDAGINNYQGSIQGNEVTAALTSFGIVRYRHM